MNIQFSVFAKPIKEQAEEQGYIISEKECVKIDELLKAWNMLRIHSMITDSESNKSMNRIGKYIGSVAVKVGE